MSRKASQPCWPGRRASTSSFSCWSTLAQRNRARAETSWSPQLLTNRFRAALYPGVFLLAKGRVMAENQPLEIVVQPGRLVRRPFMEPQEVLIQTDRLERGRLARRCLGGSQRTKSSASSKIGLSASNSKAIFRLRTRLLAGHVESQGLVGDEIVERRAVAVRQRVPFSSRSFVLGDLDLLQLGGGREGLAEMPVDLGQDRGRFQVVKSLPGRGRLRSAA